MLDNTIQQQKNMSVPQNEQIYWFSHFLVENLKLSLKFGFLTLVGNMLNDL